MRHVSLFSLTLLAAVPAFSQVSREARTMDGGVHRAVRQREWRSEASAESIRKMGRPDRKFALRRLSDKEAKPVSRKPGLTVVGVNRDVPQEALAKGEWSANSESSRVWRLALESPGADGLRVRFRDFHAGTGNVWIFGTDADGTPVSAGPYTGDGLFHDGEFWSDFIPGESIVIAWEPAEATGTDEIPFQVIELSHRLRKAKPAADEDANQAKAASCTLDVSCYAEFSEPASAVALIVFESGGETYDCSGALVSSASQPALPYFMTANHCISTQEEARSMIAFFNYQTSKCNGTPPSLGSRPRVTGSTLVAGGPMAQGDYTLLRLIAFPDIDVKTLGWYAEDISMNQQFTSISHPRGDYKRIAMGARTRDVTIRFSDGDRMPADMGYQAAWTQGVTQGGSSGSPLLVNRNGKEYLVGTLTAGPDIDEDNDAAVCRTRNLVASFGRFSAAYPALQTYLTSESAPTSSPSRTGTLTGTGLSNGRTTLSWQTTSVTRVQIRINSPSGPSMTGFEAPSGSVSTGRWVYEGMTFYLQDASDGSSAGAGKTLARYTVQTGSSRPMASMSASSVFNGATTLTWQAPGVTQVQVRVGSATGPAMTGLEAPVGSAQTGNWVSDGMVFYLQDASDGDSLGSSKTLSTVRVQVR